MEFWFGFIVGIVFTIVALIGLGALLVKVILKQGPESP